MRGLFFCKLTFLTMTKHITKITDLKAAEIIHLLDDAYKMQEQFELTNYVPQHFKGKTLAMIFEKPSLRTRVAFEVAANTMGGSAIYLSSSDVLSSGINIKGRESIPDIARNLEGFTDAVLARVYKHETVEALSKWSKIPVINGLCDLHHPTQTLADLYTIKGLFGGLSSDIKIAYVGDGCNTVNSLLMACDLLGMKISVATPKGYGISPEIMKQVKNGNVELMNDPKKAVSNADVIYTDTWISMGMENEYEERLNDFNGFQVNQELLSYAKPSVYVMHCLPAHRGEEITDEVIDGEHSIVFKQASARLPIARALLNFLFN